jgi:hypothetical protein
MSNNEIDLFKYGQVVAQVEILSKKVDDMDRDIKRLLALADQSKGGLWVGMAIVSGVSAFIGFISHYLSAK